MLVQFSVLLSACVIISAVQLPKFFNKCRKNDPNLSTCVKDSANAAMEELSNGINQIRFPSLKPLEIISAVIDVGDNLNLTLSNNKIYGIDKMRVENVIVNLTAHHYEFEIFIASLRNLGMYDVSGRILILPIFGQGAINTTFENLKIKFTFDFDFYENKGKTYMLPKNPKYTYMTDRAYFKLENLFNGNEVLSTQMNKFLDENWKEVNGEIGTRLGDVIGAILTEIIKGFMSRVPFEDFFLKENVE